jgi:hypothetical protein
LGLSSRAASPGWISLPRFFSRICKIASPGHVAGSSKPHAPSPTVGLELYDADVGHRDLLEQVWRSDDRGGISRQFGSELRMPECSPVVSGRFPDGIVEISRAFAKSSVKLGGDEARLALHENSVVLPSLEVCSSALSSVTTFTSTTGPASIAIWRSIGKEGSRGRSAALNGCPPRIRLSNALIGQMFSAAS